MMNDNLFIRFIKAMFRLLWKLFLNAVYIIGKLLESILVQLNNLIQQYL